MALTDSQLEAALRAMVEAIQAGIGIETWLQNDAATMAMPEPLREALRASIQAGGTLTTAFARTGALGDAELALLRAGEKRGNLDAALLALADAIAQRRKDRHDVLKGLAYPAFLLAAVGCILPLPRIFTDSLLSYLAVAVWSPALVLAGALFALVVVPRLKATSPLRTLPARAALRLPILGRAFERGHHATFLDVLGRSIAAGLSFPDALRSALVASGNPGLLAFEGASLRMIEDGSNLTQVIQKAGVFHPEVIAAVAQGELTGKLDETLPRAAARERAVQRRAIVTLLVIVIALVALVVLAIIVQGLISGVTGYFDLIDSQIGREGGIAPP